MPRTTIDLDASVLRELRERGRRESKTIGGLASELLAGALHRTASPAASGPLAWTSQSMGARVDLEDGEAVRAALDPR